GWAVLYQDQLRTKRVHSRRAQSLDLRQRKSPNDYYRSPGCPLNSSAALPTTMAAARNIARALLCVSIHSSAGTESATTPPPACTKSLPSLITAVRIAFAVSMSPAQAM